MRTIARYRYRYRRRQETRRAIARLSLGSLRPCRLTSSALIFAEGGDRYPLLTIPAGPAGAQIESNTLKIPVCWTHCCCADLPRSGDPLHTRQSIRSSELHEQKQVLYRKPPTYFRENFCAKSKQSQAKSAAQRSRYGKCHCRPLKFCCVCIDELGLNVGLSVVSRGTSNTSYLCGCADANEPSLTLLFHFPFATQYKKQNAQQSI